jgi:cytochrome d oxidase subunit CydB
MFDFETLKVIWWLLLGVLLIGFAVMDGFDLGVGMLLPFIARGDTERRVVINTVGPVWEGNQVWLILGGGAIFAAWPALYAASFSGFYLAMLLVLAALILRPVGFKFRSKMPGERWRTNWDWALFVGGAVPSLVFGVAMGNLIEGVPFSFDSELRATYTFGLFDLLNPFALLCGIVSVAMLITHGAVYLAMKTDGDLARRARTVSRYAALVWVTLFALAGVWISKSHYGMAIMTGDLPGGEPDPLAKTAVSQGRGLACQLRQMAVNDARSRGRSRSSLGGSGAFEHPSAPHRIHRQRSWHRRRHRQHGRQLVSISAALVLAPRQQSDGVGCLEQSSDARDHVDCGDHFPAHRFGLYELGLPSHARPGDERLH